MPKRFVGLAITGGLVAVAAVIGGAILFTSSRASEVNLTTASLVPDDAGIYLAIDANLTSSQSVDHSTWPSASAPMTRKTKVAEERGRSRPRLGEPMARRSFGGNAALYVQGMSIADLNATGRRDCPLQ